MLNIPIAVSSAVYQELNSSFFSKLNAATLQLLLGRFQPAVKKNLLFRTTWNRIQHLLQSKNDRTVQILWVKTYSYIFFSTVSKICWFWPWTSWRLDSDDWIRTSFSLSCTCCQLQGGPAAAAVQPALEQVITVLRLITLFTGTHKRWLFDSSSSVSGGTLRVKEVWL